MFIASFKLKTSIQKWLFTLQDFWDFPRLHPAREMKRLALEETVSYARKHMRSAVGMESSREVLASALRQVTLPGYYLEFGVYKGGTIRFIADTVGSAQPVHGFDSFHGLQEAWSGDPFKFDLQGRLPKVPRNVTLHAGFFADTLPVWMAEHPGPVSFIHVDSDLYEPARCIFEHLEERIQPGTIIVFDEYFNYPNWQAHEFRAFQEFVERRQVKYEYLAYARFQVAVKIAASSGGKLPREQTADTLALEASLLERE
ncbi:MAG TPA: class I SAM-dependent methyltransferase [Bryobacteraceae bacterium]|nr:class I SAM-dependent methyltransferase [Bryobacteraceae bacterium]